MPGDVFQCIMNKCNTSLEWRSAIFRAAAELGSCGSQGSASDNPPGQREDPEVAEMLQWWRQHRNAIQQSIAEPPPNTTSTYSEKVTEQAMTADTTLGHA